MAELLSGGGLLIMKAKMVNIWIKIIVYVLSKGKKR
jgi:hypothetical protein